MDERTIIVLFLLASVIGGGILVSLRKGLFSPYLLFYSYLAVGVIIRGLCLLDVSAFEPTEFWPLVAPLVEHEFFSAYLEILIAIVVATLASSLFARIPRRVEGSFLRFFSFEPREIHFGATAATTLVSCVTFVVALGATQGGIVQAFTLLQKRANMFGSEMFFIRILNIVASVAVVLLVYKVSAESRTSSRLRKGVVLSLALLNIGLLLMSGGRGALLSQLLALIFVRNRGLNKGGIGLRTASLLVIVGAVIVVGGLAVRRSAQLDISLTEAIGDSIQSSGRSISSAVPITDLYLATRNYTAATGHDYGTQFLLYFVRFVPRSVWEGKPLNLGFQMREYYYGDALSGVIPTMFGEFYVAWGAFGSVVCGLFLGWALSFLNRAYLCACQNPKFAMIYIIMATELILDGLRAGLEIAVFLLLYMLVTLACFKIARRFAQSSRQRIAARPLFRLQE